MVTLAAKLAELIIATIPALVVRVAWGIVHWLGQKLTRAATELVAVGVYYTGGWLLWAIWVLAVWYGWKLLPLVQEVLPAVADVWATGLLFTMALGLLLWTTRRHRIAVRQRRALRELSGNVRGLRREWADGLARAAEGTAVGGAFRTNRAKTERARQAAAERAAERTAAEAVAEAERMADDTRREELA